ncbi:hypothetical protein FACS1894154_02010 [Betaproteobacteria bacterium]|nr:hypothetical protein AGMMS49543_23720 [Betaproteobacteria bacterium]GHT97811.1 hypothetical protein FACS1894154_02010 [Betaproteobacteria bacterium]GHU19530.1 hypothetical protein AGMMS50243_11770 [Betaproteobacteria bacterium]
MTPQALQEISTCYSFPRTIATLIDVIGLEAAAALVTAFHGRCLSVPNAYGTNGAGRRKFERLASILGQEKAVIFCENYMGESVYIPSCRAAINQLKNKDTYAKITADFDRMTIDESLSSESAISHICNLYNVSNRHVQNILTNRYRAG